MNIAPSDIPHSDILLVDDTPDNLRLLARMLESQGHRVRKTLSGKMALQAAHRDPPDLILLDINMPEMNGYEVCKQLKASEITCEIPVIFISALDHLGDKMQAFELGGMDYITKPFQEQEVLVRVKSQLLIQQQRRQLVAQNQQLQQEIQERQRIEAEVKQLNANLEQKVYFRTLELQQVLTFEATLKRISDRVRDSLDQHQILQAAVEELAKALDVCCCDATLYSDDHLTSTICYQYAKTGLIESQGQLLDIEDVPELHDQLQQQHCFAFCQLSPNSISAPFAILACPIFDDLVEQQGTLGNLWLFKSTEAEFVEAELNLVQQVANQCAIALRQAHLYEAAQAQVQALQRLNHLKDEFLSTISHELRTPISNMKQTLQLLMNPMPGGSQTMGKDPQLMQYLAILEEECDRELQLIGDLLHLQHLEAGVYVLQPMTIHLQDWIPHMVESFQIPMQHQQQTLLLDLPADLPPITTDVSSFSRIVMELLHNACKYTPKGKTIQIAAQIINPDQSEPSDAMPYLKLSISNTGIEIPAEELSRIFDKFYRIPNGDPWKHGGIGLGLALVKKLVEQMGGSINARSTQELTCFTIQLPLTLNQQADAV